MILSPFVERLAALGCFVHVGEADELGDVTEAGARLPAAFVVAERSTAERNRMAGVVDQRVTERITVALLVGAGRAVGTKARLRPLELTVIGSLVGWVPPEGSAPVEYDGSRFLGAGNGLVVHGVSFNSAWRVRSK